MNLLLHSKILGSGKPLLVLHGLFGMSDNWNTFGNVFAADFQVHLLDLRNHGRSFQSQEFNYNLMVDDVYNYIQHYKLPKVLLLGHSMGGKVAQFFTLKYPELIEKLIVVDIAPKFYPVHHQELIDILKSVDFNAVKNRKEVDDLLSKSIKEENVKQFLLKNIFWEAEDKLAFRFNLEAISKHIEELGKEVVIQKPINIPTLFIKGAKSNYITTQNFEAIYQKFINSQIEIIPNAAHWVHAENPSDFNKSVFNFIHLNTNSQNLNHV